jgi:hypothetical protein
MGRNPMDSPGKVDQQASTDSSLPFMFNPENFKFLVGKAPFPLVEKQKPWRKLAGLTIPVFVLLWFLGVFYYEGVVDLFGLPLRMALIGSGLFLVGLIYYLSRRHENLLCEGKLLEGRVISADFLRDKILVPIASVPFVLNGELHIRIDYVFQSPAGRAVSGSEEKIVEKFSGQLPQRGTRVMVVYLNDNNYKML